MRIRSALLLGLCVSWNICFAAGAGLHLQAAYVTASLPGTTTVAAYLELKNLSKQEWVLVSASSPAAHVVEVHRHVMEGNSMRMEKVDSLPIPAGGIVRMQPGGYHLMLIGLNKALSTGDHVLVTLKFSNGRAETVVLNVK